MTSQRPKSDVERALAEFVAAHRGLRLARTFAVPTAYAGRRAFARVMGIDLACRLPRDLARRELASGARPLPRRRIPVRRSTKAPDQWVCYRLPRGALTRHLARVLEHSAHHAAAISVRTVSAR